MTNTTDIFATVASIIGYALPDQVAVDSFDMAPVLLGKQPECNSIRPHLLTQSFHGEFQLRQGSWKYLDHQGSGGNRYDAGIMQSYSLPETEPDAKGQLYHLENDPGETTNLYFSEERKRKEMQELLASLIGTEGRSAPLNRQPISNW